MSTGPICIIDHWCSAVAQCSAMQCVVWTGVWTVDCGLWTVDCGLWGYGVWCVECGLWSVGQGPSFSAVVNIRIAPKTLPLV